MVDFKKKLQEAKSKAPAAKTTKSSVAKSTAAPAEKMSLRDRLAALQTEWQNAEVMEGFGELPEGKYTCLINSATINESKSSDRMQVSWDFTVVEGDFANRRIFKHDGIEEIKQLGFLRTSLHRLGVEWPSSPDLLPDTLEGLSNLYCEVTIKVKGEFTNVYINKALDPSEVDTSALTEGGEGEAPAETVEPTAEPEVEAEPELAVEEELVEEEVVEGPPTFATPTAAATVMNPAQTQELLALVKKADLKPKSKKPTEILLELATYSGLTGEFASKADMLKAIAAVLA